MFGTKKNHIKIQGMFLKNDEDNEEQKHKGSFNTRSVGVLGLASSADRGIREMASVCEWESVCLTYGGLLTDTGSQGQTHQWTCLDMSMHANICMGEGL